MDSLGIAYRYEPEFGEVEAGLRRVWYKPDFFLPKPGVYLEIKPKLPSESEVTKACGWASYVGDVVVLFNLNPPDPENENGWLYACETGEIGEKPIQHKWIYWGECPRCLKIDLTDNGIPTCGCFSREELNRLYEREEEGEIPTPFYRSNRLAAAYRKAKSHDFRNENRVKPIRNQAGLWDGA
jgi:hypothetical protein